MAFDELTKNVQELSDNVQQYANKSAEYYKLDLFEKSMRSATELAKLLVLGGISLLVLVFLSLGFAIYLGRILDHPSWGYFIVGGIYFVVFILVYLFGRQKIERAILVKFSKTFFKEQ
ncbi:phage holin family protein [Croceiramulus getboli]|nr:phage holin family protein [Flavobacteriaceae bacterium YJPT1-3]